MQFNLETTASLFLLLMWSRQILPAGGCPDRCLCTVSTKHVSCEGAGLTDPPTDIHPSVTALDLRRNLLTRLGSDLMAPLANVVRLTLSENRLESIADDTFRDSRSLQVLELSGNNLTYLTGAAMRGAEMLLQLDLSSNRLERVDGAFDGMRILSRLDLSANRLSSITGATFRGLSNLRYLLLSRNRISSFEHDAFLDLERLMHLVLKGNPIVTAEFRYRCPYLSYIDLSECQLTGIPRGLPPTLRYLQLRRNNISAVGGRGSLDAACPDLGILVLDENVIGDVTDDAVQPFVSMSKLQQLWLNFNGLARIPNVTAHVQRLLLESNGITELSTDSFPVHSRIDTLSLAGNLIARIESGALNPLTELHNLDLSNNRLVSIDGDTFVKNSRLKALQLSRNPLVELKAGCFNGLTSLRQLSLAFISSPAVTVADDIFRDADGLARLDLDSSPGVIRAFSAGADDLLTSLAGVRELSMRSSNLRTLRPDFPEFFPNLAVFRVSSSRWHCDTSMLWFKVWLSVTSTEVTDAANSNRCNTPPHLRNRSLVFLSNEDFVPTTTQPTGPHPGQDEEELGPVVAAPAPPDKSRTTFTSDSRVLLPFPLLPEASGQSEWDYRERPASLSLGTSPPRSETVTKTSTNNSFYDKIKQRTEITGDHRHHHHHHQSDGKTEPSRPSIGSSSDTLVIVVVVSLLVVFVVALGIVVSVLLLKNLNRLPQGNAAAQKTKNNCARKPGLSSPSDGLPSSESSKVREITYDSGYFLQQALSTTSTPPPPTMTLVPGRDINHEGPHRVYTWIDF